jgi:hydrophobe/amphiphile efflux-3 (HAE3) family protein
MATFSQLVIKFRIPIIIITVIITGISVYLLKFDINADLSSYLPKDDPSAKLYRYIGQKYAGSNIAIVALETDDIFNKQTIEHINSLTNEFKLLEGVAYVTSLTNVLDIKTLADGMDIGKLIDEYNLPQTDEELAQIKNYTLSRAIYNGRLVSADSTVTLIICRLFEDFNKGDIATSIRENVKKQNLTEKVYYSGIPFQILEISEIIVNDVIFLIPLAGLVILLVLFFSFRTVKGVLLPIITVGISIVWTVGVMSILNVPISIISNIIPVVLIATGSAYSIHVINRFGEYEGNESRISHSISSLREICIPVMLAAFTTMIGFIAFVYGSYLTIIREFGIFSCIGIFFAFLVSVTFVPAVLSFLVTKKQTTPKKSDTGGMKRIMDRIGSLVLANNRTIIFIGIIIAIISIIGIPMVNREIDMLSYFKGDTNIRKAESIIGDKLGGSVPVQILVKGDIQDPSVLQEMKTLETYLKDEVELNNPQSIVEIIEEMNKAMGEGKKIPDSKRKITDLWFLIEGDEIVSQLVNEDKTEALISATTVNFNTRNLKSIVEKIEAFINTHNSSTCTFQQTGLSAIYNSLDESLVNSQIQSLVIAILMVFIVNMILMRSILGGLMGIIPISFTLLFLFGFMGFSTIPLDIATVLVGSISLGIGIDYSIHFIHRFKSELKKQKSIIDSLNKTLETTGKGILINVSTVTLGFLVLLLSSLIPLNRFALLIAITMIGSGVGAITLLPAFIIVTKIKFYKNNKAKEGDT